MTPDVIKRQVVLEEHDLAPSGTAAVVVRRFVAGESYRSHLWFVPLDGGRSRQLTVGAVRDTHPRFSPDGLRLGFVRGHPEHSEEPTQLMVLELGGGEPWTLVAMPHGVGSFAWDPSGERLAIVAPADPPRFLVGTASPGHSPTARRIDRLDWRLDGLGLRDRRDHLWVVQVRDGASPRQVTRGDYDIDGPAWSPDGSRIAFAADRAPDGDLHPRSSIWAIAAVGGEPEEVLALDGYAHSPAWSPDGRWLAAVGVDEPTPLDDTSPGIFVGPSDGSQAAHPLAPALDRPIGVWVDTDLNGWMAPRRPGPFWQGADALVALVSSAGRSLPWRFPVDPATGLATGEPQAMTDADAACWTLAVAPARPMVSVVGTLDGRAMELMTLGAGDSGASALRTRTSLGSAWQRQLTSPEMRHLVVDGPGGPIETWVASPPGSGDDPLPTIVDVHGGPLGAWAPAPSIEVGLLVSRGYRVLLPNIRGSAGYGRDWIRPQLGDWGGVDADDVLAVVDRAVEVGLADPGRLGILGLSYGGFMTQWLVGHTNRFRAAVAENGVTNQINAWGNCDFGVNYNRGALLGDPLTHEGMERLWRQSPMAHVSDVHTPILMLQAEADRRDPAADNEQFFVALRVLGRPVDYVLYPDEFHLYATIGRPDRRIDRMTRMLDWFDRYVLG
jgi:dipeptidyl aminopeptidase/acylaminoacyl peptidase